MASIMPDLSNHLKLVSSPAIRRLMSIVRDKGTNQKDFVTTSNRVMRLLVEEALCYIPHSEAEISTACGTYNGLIPAFKEGDICGVSIVRSGNTMLEALREIIPDLNVGHVLVQRDESDPDKKPIFYYRKFPGGISKMPVMLCDPMLATGGSAKAAVKCLVEEGVPVERIVLVVLIAAPEGVAALKREYPGITIVAAELDPCLNEHKFIVPGLGDFGDRYYNTE